MTKEDYIRQSEDLAERIHDLHEKIREAHQTQRRLDEEYVRDALAASGYAVGQPYTDREGRLWYVAGAYVSIGGSDVRLLFNFSKKDGTMSKVSGVGRGMPYVKIL